MQRPAPVQHGVLVQRLVHAHRQDAQVGQALGEHPVHGQRDLVELHPGLDRLQAGLLRGVHDVVDLSLRPGEPAGDRQRAGDVGGVEVPVLRAHIGQQQVAGRDRAVVALPVQDRRVRAGADDGVVPQAVAVVPGAQPEHPLDQPLGDRPVGRQHPGHVLEAADGDLDRLTQLGDLPLVLDQLQLGERGGQLGVPGAVAVVRADQAVHGRVDAAQHAGARRSAVAQRALQVGHWRGLYAQLDRLLGERLPPADPQLAVRPVDEELVGVPR